MKWLTVLLIATAAPASAHDTWLSAASTDPSTALLELRLSTGHDFPKPESASRVASIEAAELHLDARALPLLPGERLPHWLELKAPVGTADVALARLSLKPSTVELSPASARTYLKELGEPAALVERARTQAQWRERFSKHAKALVRRGGADVLPAATRPLGLPYELVPSSDPSLLMAEQVFEVCAFTEGRAAGAAYIGLVEADGRASWQWSDERGCVRVAPDSDSGFLLRSVRLQPANAPGLEWTSHFASLSVFRPMP